jgi:hypothetical protein
MRRRVLLLAVLLVIGLAGFVLYARDDGGPDTDKTHGPCMSTAFSALVNGDPVRGC